jgi:hypothetical protein
MRGSRVCTLHHCQFKRKQQHDKPGNQNLFCKKQCTSFKLDVAMTETKDFPNPVLNQHQPTQTSITLLHGEVIANSMLVLSNPAWEKKTNDDLVNISQ